MKIKKLRAPAISSDQLKHVRRRLNRWRKTRRRRSPIPEHLWAAAVMVARQMGVSRTSRILNLDYYALKKRLDAHSHSVSPSQSGAPTFLELVAPVPVPECSVELEHPGGAKLRIHLTGMESPNLAKLHDTSGSGE